MKVFAEKFADIKILRYELTDFEKLSLQQKQYIYYLGQAALCGRDMLWDQNNRYNLRVRRLLETIYQTYRDDRQSDLFQQFEVYLKRVWFSNGIHHHYSMDKIKPDFSGDDLQQLISASDLSAFPFQKELDELVEVITNPALEAKRVSLDSSKDLLQASAMNYYRGVSQAEAEAFYKAKNQAAGENAPSFGLNSQLVKEDGQLKEKVWKADGQYGKAIQQIVFWLEKALPFAENDLQQTHIRQLIAYYQTGDLKQFDEYSISWVNELDGMVDFVNGFIEVYGDPLGMKGSWESIVNYKDVEGTKRATILSENAQWFETHSPVADSFKKKEVKGVSAKVIHVAMLGGDCYPHTPIGINLPNAEWIREEYGSKSVTIENITKSYFLDSLGNGMLEEFAESAEEVERAQTYGYLAGNLHTDLHECLGHGSGKMMPGVKPEDLKNYYSTLEETRADLFALYYVLDEKLLDLGLVPSMETGKAEYDAYLRNGLITQLTRIEPGKDLEESHMRNRQLIAKWAFEQGQADGVVDWMKREGKSYLKINDYQKLRELFGQLLAEVQRIKSEGDLQAAAQLVENYGVKVDRELHAEVLERFKKLDIAPYAGFLNPELRLLQNEQGEVVDVEVQDAPDYTAQMLAYSSEYGFL
ncbi:dipeptidyl-peptidase 3 family protein [Sunxiuqinia dokdonensis]|uniref:Dihydrofolate reductase n=1 Tax=Sunxiuqinia dokdonensis TaxID=1409788 RepID=A0A0L8VBB4_9BACT|nr:dihydrofolate reductase [Sunxiuqinia dokdonensis]KOH45770.1 dihydrofolate reductase [Sunxiuqinia dokdonensis]